jgi:hypothetical protein
VKKFSNKKAIIIGFGGMGKRYAIALENLNIKVIGICDKKINNFKNVNFSKNYKSFLNLNADLVCIVANTAARKKITLDFIKYSKIRNIIIEKPITNSVNEAYQIKKFLKKSKKRLLVNTFRSISPNFIKVKRLFDQNDEEIKSINILSPSAGIGNMGSTYFDLCNFFLEEKCESVFGIIDKTNTKNPRGKKFKDPGCRGFMSYKKNKRVLFDMSEDTSLPYKFIIKSRNIEFHIDEVNNNFFYLFKPEIKKMKLIHKFSPAMMTRYTITKIFGSKFKSNIDDSINVMNMIFGIKASFSKNKVIKLPLKGLDKSLKYNFA